tara:strand:+ start:77 stop:469 length:393 start_codon:yes stop_codon:yes gene_type:complete
MKKIKIGSPYWAVKFFAALLLVSFVGTMIMMGLTYLFGIVPVFFGCCAIVFVSGLILTFVQIRDHYKEKKEKKMLSRWQDRFADEYLQDLKDEMHRAIKDQRYEEAAKIRDKIHRHKQFFNDENKARKIN